MRKLLTLKELQTASNALRVAAEQYERDAATVSKMKIGAVRILQQFQQQALDARDLADKLDDLMADALR